EVRDSGIGVAPDAQRRIFESFAQADQSTTRRYGGTGLGLAIAKQLTHMMGGEIGVDSKAGEGSAFWFTVRVGIIGEEGEDPKRRLLSGIRALVVDGTASSREAFSAQLASLGITSRGIDAEDAALSLLQLNGRVGRRFDVVFIDRTELPDAAALVKEIRNDAAIAQTRIILLESRAASVDRGVEDPFGDVERLLKPVRQSALYDCLSTTIQAKSATAKFPAPPQAESIPARILIAEDNPVNREVAGEALRQLGCLVDTANDGQQAIAAWEGAHYDLVL